MPNPYTNALDFVREAKSRIKTWADKMFPEKDDRIPSDKGEDRERLADFVRQCFEDSAQWRETSFQGRMGYHDPVKWFTDARKLEQGMHWDVWGRRNQEPGQQWKQELVDDESGNQTRLKKAYLTGAWHDITIQPNIDNLTDIARQERTRTGWNKLITTTVMRGLTEGTAITKEVLDKGDFRAGRSKTFLCDNASIFPTPFAKGLEVSEGTWYLAYATMQSEQQVFSRYKKLTREMIAESNSSIKNQLSRTVIQTDTEEAAKLMHSLERTKLLDVVELWLDDPRLETIPFEESAEEIGAEHEAIYAGAPTGAKVEERQNHKAHIEAHLAWLDEEITKKYSDYMDITPNPEIEEEQKSVAGAVVAYTLEHIAEHQRQAQSLVNEDIPVGHRLKYPCGRKVSMVSGVIADDENVFEMYGFDWRKLFRVWRPEIIPDHFWGRGPIEVLYNTNKVEDTMLSRTADAAIMYGTPKPHYHISDKDIVESPDGGFDNDPSKPAYYRTKPPEFPKGTAPKENLEIYNVMKENAAKQQGVSDVSYGKSPGANAAAKLVQILLQQNQVIVTGEANQNLDEFITEVTQTKVLMWKRWYVEPRVWFIDGIPKNIILSRRLKYFKTQGQNGEEIKEEIPEFNIEVQPNSNFPQMWEINLAMLTELYAMQRPDGMPLIPPEALYDHLAQRFPKLGRDGEYYQASQATAIGMQVMAQQQAQMEAQQKAAAKGGAQPAQPQIAVGG